MRSFVVLSMVITTFGSSAVTAQSPAGAGRDWVFVTQSSLNDRYYYRPNEPQQPNIRPTFWFWIDHSLNQKTKIRKTMKRMRFDCANQKTATLAVIEYAPDGSNPYSREYSYPTDSMVVPGSVGEDMWAAVCQPSTP